MYFPTKLMHFLWLEGSENSYSFQGEISHAAVFFFHESPKGFDLLWNKSNKSSYTA